MTTLALALLALAGVPTALTLLARQLALATEDADPALVWFRFARLQRLAVLLTRPGRLAAMRPGTLRVPAAAAARRSSPTGTSHDAAASVAAGRRSIAQPIARRISTSPRIISRHRRSVEHSARARRRGT